MPTTGKLYPIATESDDDLEIPLAPTIVTIGVMVGALFALPVGIWLDGVLLSGVGVLGILAVKK